MPMSSSRSSWLEIEYQLLVTLRRVRWACLITGPLFFAAIFALLKCRHSVEEVEVFGLCGALLGFVFGVACERFASAMIGTLMKIVRVHAVAGQAPLGMTPVVHDGIERSKQLS